MTHLCFLSSDIRNAKVVVQDLKADAIVETKIYVIAKLGTPMQELSDEGSEADDLVHAFECDIAIGGTAGIILGLFAFIIPPDGVAIGGDTVILSGLMGLELGGLLTCMAGADCSSSR